MTPTTAEFVAWCVMGGLAVLVLIALALPWNTEYKRKGNDPYRYCPKEEE